MKNIVKILIALSLSSYATEYKSPIEKLSGETRGLLITEMQHIENAMHGIFSHIVKGELEDVSKLANNIENSFIFKIKLTQKQVDELKANLPKEFMKLDHEFHSTAGELSNAAEFEEKENVIKSYNKMMNLCISCHSDYAKHRFSGFED